MLLAEHEGTSALPADHYRSKAAPQTAPPQTVGIRFIVEGSAGFQTTKDASAWLAALLQVVTGFAQIPAHGASVWSTDTFGSKYQDAAFILENEYRAQRMRRAYLLRKRYCGTLTQGERDELEMLQAAEGSRLSAELRPAIDHVKSLLRA